VLDQAVVRERDAHAWVEVWFANHGWVPVDPTPGVPGLAATQFPNHWAAGGIARLIPHLQVGAPLAVLGSLGVLGAIPAVLAVGAVAVVLLLAIWRWRGRRRPVRPAAGESELLRLYERVQRRLGRRRAPPETPLEYRLEADAGRLAPLLTDLTEAVNEGVYAGRWPGPDRVRELADRLS
jgi:hypothetical protein